MQVNTLLSLKQVGKILNVSAQTVRLLIKRGVLKAAPSIERNQRIAIDEVNRYLESCGSSARIETPTDDLPVQLVAED